MTSHTIYRLTSSLYGKPHLIDKVSFEAITAYLNQRNNATVRLDYDDEFDSPPEEAPKSFDATTGVGVITIHGPLTNRKSLWEGMCGGFSYESMLAQAEEMIAAGVKTIVIDADSGGGEAYGCFEATDELRKMCTQAGVKLLGYVDGSACSAMYGIICACDEIIANPQSQVGSIGVLIALMNDSEHLKQEGYERIFVTDGTEKVPFASDGSFRVEFLESLQTRCAELGDSFREHVAKHTGLSTDVLKATNAKVFSAKDALQIGLVSKIQTRSEFAQYVVDKHKEANNA